MIEKFFFRNIEFFILRDDLLGEFNGNKARKLEFFLNQDLSNFKGIVSYGSSQSNAMQSLSLFAKLKGLEFHYVISHLNSNLKQNPIGNFENALKNQMILYIQKDRELYAKELAKDKNLLLIPEGVAMSEAELGFKKQAREIEKFADESGIKFDIFLPSGTGASACYLAKNTKFNVITCPCVGDKKYLQEEIFRLDKNSKVKILNPPKKYHFGDLKIELFQIYKELKDSTGIEFELIYDPIGFLSIFSNLNEFKNKILYIHQGGILGNISQKLRYERKFKGLI